MSRMVCLRSAHHMLAIRPTRQLQSISHRWPSHYKPNRALPLRCYASGDKDKSWNEIGSEAMELGKALFNKAKSSVSKVVESIVPTEEPEPPRVERRQRKREEEQIFPAPNFGGGLLGNLLGKAVGKAINSLASELREAQERSLEVQERVAAIIESSSKVRDRLGGGVQCYPPVSQSSSSMSVNGRRTKSVTLILPIMSSRGQATAEAVYNDGDSGDELTVTVVMPNGERIKVNDNSGPFKTIDVEWKSVD